MEELKIRFQVETVHRWTRGVYIGVVLQGWLLEGELTPFTRLRLPLRNGAITTGFVILLGVIQENEPVIDGIPGSRTVDRIVASSERVHVGLDMLGTRVTPDDVDFTRLVQGVT
jgi:hypothetical protein